MCIFTALIGACKLNSKSRKILVKRAATPGWRNNNHNHNKIQTHLLIHMFISSILLSLLRILISSFSQQSCKMHIFIFFVFVDEETEAQRDCHTAKIVTSCDAKLGLLLL